MRKADLSSVQIAKIACEALAVHVVKLANLRGFGLAASAVILTVSIGYGVVRGERFGQLQSWLGGLRDYGANTVGFRISGVSFVGLKNVNREEILARAGITGMSSLLFLNVADARARLKTDPRIADATVLKLYPDRLQITIEERQPFALWQKDGRVSVIAADGTVLESYVAPEFITLPMFVGVGAETRAQEFLALLDKFPTLRAEVRASVLVAERRWNLRLKNGIDVKLPESDVERALGRLVALDKDKNLTSRDIVTVDLRQPDRVIAQLSNAAAQARDAANKDKQKPKKGGNA
jgi:cell division protein FtsQ